MYCVFAVLQDKESFLKQLIATEDWLYEEGEDETKSVYVKKLDELKVKKHACMLAHTHYIALFSTIRKLVIRW